MKRTLASLLALALLAPPATADETFAVLSLFYPASTNRNPDVNAHFRLSLLHARVGSLRGLDLNLVTSQASADVSGVQWNGIFGGVAGAVRGVQLSGAVNYVGGEMRGAQAAVLANYVRGNARGIQLSAVLNYNESKFSGLQLNAGLNMTEGDATGLQLAGLANVTNGDSRGAQLSSFLNATNGRARGLQVGVSNLATTAAGVQIGLLNLTRENRGLQVGAVNLSTDQEGVPVGLVNYSENADVDLVVFGSNLMAVNAGVRTTANGFYSFLAVGGLDLKEEDESEAASASWNFGYAAPISSRFELGGDLGFVHIVPEIQDDPDGNNRTHYAIQARALAEITVSRKVSIFAALGGSAVVSEYSQSATTDFEPHVAAGLALF